MIMVERFLGARFESIPLILQQARLRRLNVSTGAQMVTIVRSQPFVSPIADWLTGRLRGGVDYRTPEPSEEAGHAERV